MLRSEMKILSILVSILFFPAVLSQNRKPHIITIFIDDLGWHDVGFHGNNQIKTPNIDALAYSGMILNRHYVLPSCTPSRAALLTGSYPIRSGMQGFPLKGGENRNLPLSFKLKPAHLKDLGYKTHIIGKWHLGYQTYSHIPNNRGFDTFFGYYNGFVDYYSYYYNQSLDSVKSSEDMFRGYDLHNNNDIHRLNDSIYATHLFTEHAKKVIREHDASEPLYLYFSHVATHTGSDDYLGMQAPKNADVNKTYSHIKHFGRRVFARVLEELDISVGVVMKELKDKKMLDNSIILVMSDNGAHTVSNDMAPNWSSNWPLLGTKFTLYEGGVRGAALIWSPLLPKGFVNEGFLHIADWLPTFYSAAGGDVKNLGSIDGVDQWNALKNITTVKRDYILLNINERTLAEGIIVKNRWKVIKGGFPTYGNYENHWGEEENVAPNPPYNIEEITKSPAGIAVQSVPGYNHVFDPKQVTRLRDKAKVKCELPKNEVKMKDGYVDESHTHRCQTHCVFDLLNDPCETKILENTEISQLGRKFLRDFKKVLVLQKVSAVDPESNPKKFNGAWMPWDVEKCAASKAEEFSLQYVNISILITLTWYGVFRKRESHP